MQQSISLRADVYKSAKAGDIAHNAVPQLANLKRKL
jgi:hypothetical protein